MSQYFIDVTKYAINNIKAISGANISVITNDYRNIRFFTDDGVSRSFNIYQITDKEDLHNKIGAIYHDLFG